MSENTKGENRSPLNTNYIIDGQNVFIELPKDCIIILRTKSGILKKKIRNFYISKDISKEDLQNKIKNKEVSFERFFADF